MNRLAHCALAESGSVEIQASDQVETEIMPCTDPDRFLELAEQYNTHAEFCREAAECAVDPCKEQWLRLAAQWTKLAEEANGRSRPS